jgi:RimJ/RimL family protein N-acetyltransferase
VFKGPSVSLRPVERADFRRLWEFEIDLEVHVLADDEPPVPRTFESFEKFIGDLADKEEPVMFAIDVDDVLIGSCMLGHFDKTARVGELSITIGDKAYWGKGYGSEAVALLIEYAFVHRNLNRVWLGVSGDNERAIRAYARAGFVEEARLRDHMWMGGALRDMVVMGVLRPEWEARQAQ